MAVKKKINKVTKPEVSIEEPIETPVVEEVEVEAPVEEPIKPSKDDGIKEYTEEELVIMSREEQLVILEDIKAGKAKVKPRF